MRPLFFITACLAFAIDQFSKWLIVFKWDLQSLLYMDVWPGFITFINGLNDGMNFGLFADGSAIQRWVLIAIALAVCVAIVIWAWGDTRRSVQAFTGLVVGGALGNVLDRIIHGAVIDFLNVTCCGINNPYVFNLADVFVFAGAIGLVLFVRDDRRS